MFFLFEAFKNCFFDTIFIIFRVENNGLAQLTHYTPGVASLYPLQTSGNL